MSRQALFAFPRIALLACVTALLCAGGCQCGEREQGQEPKKAPLRVATSGDKQAASEIVTTLSKAGVPAETVGTGSSIASLKALSSGKADVALVPVDVAWYALNGKGVFDEKVTGFSAVIPMRYEVVGFMVRADSAIQSVQDLRGRRVVVGPPGSRLELTAAHLLAACGLRLADLGRVMYGTPLEGMEAVREGRADAWLEPDVLNVSRLDGFHGTLLPPSGLKSLAADHPFYICAPSLSDPASFWAEAEGAELPGHAMLMTAVFTRDDLPADAVERVSEALAAYNRYVDRSRLLPDQMSIPLHPGAKAYLEARSHEGGDMSPSAE